MSDNHPHHSSYNSQASAAQGNSQQEVLLRGVGTRFGGSSANQGDVAGNVRELPGNAVPRSPLLGDVLGRSTTTKDAQKRLLESDVIATLCSRRPS
ncbi:hypothetical protein F5Y04DRAFT_259025 [Hypomontagnella monticulosa]|nr:hypothetical protein F5Y04DRAFT_259025 [Hypomontagnella monticulosa]